MFTNRLSTGYSATRYSTAGRVATGLAGGALLLCTACGSTQTSSVPQPGGSPGSATAAETAASAETVTSTRPAGTGATSAQPAAPAGQAATGPARYRALPVYYVVDTAAGFRLYREFHRVRTADPASDAVREMLARDRGIDPDYRSAWPAGTALRSPVRHAKGVITVDLTARARAAQVGAELAEMTVQQLVYTVEGALQSTDPVRILVEGRRVEQLWGHVATGQPVRRADQYATRSLVQINDPNDGATVPRTFTVTGEAAAFEANVPWEVLRDGAVVRSGFTTAAEGQRFSPFRFSLTLEPGEYVVRVMEESAASPGEGRPPFEDTRRVRVVG